MRAPSFGRKGLGGPRSAPPPPPAPPPPVGDRPGHQPGHQSVLAQLRERDANDPHARLKLAGRVMFDFVHRMIANERGVRIEDLLGILAATGGFACIVGVMQDVARRGLGVDGVMIATVRGKDGWTYYFGDLLNAALLESSDSLLSLALGAANALGGRVSLDMVHETMRRVAGSVGGAGFGMPELPEAHRPGDTPINYVRYLWPKIVEGLDLYEVPPAGRATALGFAIQQAMAAGKDTIDMTIAARIVIECAVPMAKLDPVRFA